MKQKYSKKLGFLLTHGTDTMSWALSAIRYMLKNLPANVAITGSQVPLSRQFTSSDVYPNIENSIKLLTQLTGPDIFVVFNNGRVAFQDDLWKIDKWSPDAFSGEELAKISTDEIIIQGRAYPLNLTRKLDKFYLLRTGGTIESESNEEGILLPTANIVSEFIEEKFNNFYEEFIPKSIMSVDSSDMILNAWLKIGKEIAERCQENGYTTFCDDKFNPKIAVINVSPLMTEEDYKTQFKKADGIILNAYGSGTINTEISSGFSPLPAIDLAIQEGKVVVISSLTPFGTQDFIYSNAWEPIQRGAIPAGDFSIAHSQIKLSYILGHRKEIQKVAKKYNIPFETFVKVIFLSGVDFRSYASRKKFEKLIGYPIPIKDPFFNLPFEIALEKVIRFINRKDTRQLCINSIEQFEQIYLEYLKEPKLRSKWAVILKPDTVIGSNQWGELIDASTNFATITKEILDWNILIIELSEINYQNLLEKIKQYCVNETIGQFLRTFRYVVIEGGRQSLYDANSFDEISNGNFTKKDYLHLLTSLMLARNNPDSNPGLFLCLGHQGIGEALREYLVKLIQKSNKLAKIIAKSDSNVSEKFTTLINEIRNQGNEIQILNRSGKLVAKGLNDTYFAVKKNEIPEIGLKKLAVYKPSKGLVPDKMLKEYEKITKFHTGILEDFYSLESLDIVMLHGDEVNEEAVLFMNWALMKISKFSRENYGILISDSELKELTSLPFGLEIHSSTLYAMDSMAEDYLTEIASLVLYYYNPETQLVKRDYTLQFHPELFEEIRILQKRDFESKTLLELSDGIQLLLSSLQAGFITTTYNLN